MGCLGRHPTLFLLMEKIAMEKLHYEDLGVYDGYDRVLRTTVNGNKVTLCFKDESQGKNIQNIVKSLKDAYSQRVKKWT